MLTGKAETRNASSGPQRWSTENMRLRAREMGESETTPSDDHSRFKVKRTTSVGTAEDGKRKWHVVRSSQGAR